MFSIFSIFFRMISNSKFNLLYLILIFVRNRASVFFYFIDIAHSCQNKLISLIIHSSCARNIIWKRIDVENYYESFRNNNSIQYINKKSTLYQFKHFSSNYFEKQTNLSKFNSMCNSCWKEFRQTDKWSREKRRWNDDFDKYI